MKISDIKTKLSNGKATIGTWMQIPNTSIAEILGKAGYDWVTVDLEHGRFSQSDIPNLFRAIELGGTLPFARIANTTLTDVKEALDSGAKGLIFPMIETAEQLSRAIAWSLFPPKGIRGVGYSRANLFGKEFNEYVTQANEILFVAQIEHVNAVHNLDNILKVKHLDAIMVGPYDLSASMGLIGKFDHEDFKNIMQAIQKKAKQHNIPMGLHIVQPQPEILKEKINDGYQFLAYCIDAVFLYQSSNFPEI